MWDFMMYTLHRILSESAKQAKMLWWDDVISNSMTLSTSSEANGSQLVSNVCYLSWRNVMHKNAQSENLSTAGLIPQSLQLQAQGTLESLGW